MTAKSKSRRRQANMPVAIAKKLVCLGKYAVLNQETRESERLPVVASLLDGRRYIIRGNISAGDSIHILQNNRTGDLLWESLPDFKLVREYSRMNVDAIQDAAKRMASFSNGKIFHYAGATAANG